MYSVAELCLTLWDPMNSSQPVSSLHEIFQARILKWVSISYSRGSSWPKDRTHVSCISGHVLYHCATWEAHKYMCVCVCVCVCTRFFIYLFSALVRLPVHSLTSRGHSQGHSHSFCSILKSKRKSYYAEGWSTIYCTHTEGGEIKTTWAS